MRMVRAIIAFVCLAVLPGPGTAIGVGEVAAQDVTYFRIGTGSTTGTYFPIGEALANLISRPPGAPACADGGRCGVPGVIGLAQATDGSLANIEAISLGRIESGLAQGDLVYWGFNGQGIFKAKGRQAGLRVIASLYRESVHLVVRKGAGIHAVPDLRGKRVSLDRRESGTYVDAVLILKAFGLREVDFIAVHDDQNQSIDALLAGDLDAFLFVGGYPATGISDLARRGAIDIIGIEGAPARAIIAKYPFFVADVIAAGVYPGIGEVKTIGVGAQWVVSSDVDEALIYQITRALWHPRNREILVAAHEKGRLITLETALDGVAIKLHPGAERFYREVGMIREPAANQ